MNSEENNEILEQGDIINSRKRGGILYYTISQVATILEEEESNILYFTNIFDDILNIKISDKELRYTDRDIDKLEYLINLKNKGLTIKEIQKYCEELSFDSEETIIPKAEVAMPTEGIVEEISKSQSELFDNLKEYFDKKIEESNEILSEKIVKQIEEEQSKQIKLLKEEILNELTEISSNTSGENEDNGSLDEISAKIDKLVADKLSFEDTIRSEFEKFNEMYESQEKNIIDEIKRNNSIMEQARYVEQEMDKKSGFFSKIFSNGEEK